MLGARCFQNGQFRLISSTLKNQKEPQSQTITRTVPKTFLNSSRVLTNKTTALEANSTRKFTRKSGKILVAQVLWGTFSVPDTLYSTLDGQNCQSLAFSERGQPSQVILQFHVERMPPDGRPIARSESQCNGRTAYEDYSVQTDSSNLSCKKRKA